MSYSIPPDFPVLTQGGGASWGAATPAAGDSLRDVAHLLGQGKSTPATGAYHPGCRNPAKGRAVNCLFQPGGPKKKSDGPAGPQRPEG